MRSARADSNINSDYLLEMASEALRSKWLKLINNKDDPLFKFLDVKTLFCKACETSVEVHQKSQIDQHVNSTKHKTNLKIKTKRKASQAQLRA